MNNTFTQKYVEEVPIAGLSREQFFNLAIETCKSLGWVFGSITETGFVAYTSNGVFNWNAEVQFKLTNSTAKILSQSRNVRSIEIDKDKKNLKNFLATLNKLKSSKMALDISHAYMNVA